MPHDPYFSDNLFRFLECLGFKATKFIGDETDQIKFIHPTKNRIASRKNWIPVPSYKVYSKRLVERIMVDVEEFGFSTQEINDCVSHP